MTRLRAALAGTLIGLGACAPAAPVSQPGARAMATALRTDSSTIAFLIDEGARRSRVEPDLQHLTDVIGPRLTGSPAMRRANEWVAARLREYGVDSVAQEPWPFGVTWERGPIRARLIAPHEREIPAVSWAWAPGTNGPVAGAVVHVDATTPEEFTQRFAGRLRGAWVMTSRAYPRTIPGVSSPADSARVDSMRAALRSRNAARTPAERAFLGSLPATLAAEGIAGLLVDAAKDYGLFVMAGSPDEIPRYPMVVVANETYAELHRHLDAGRAPRLEIAITNRFGRDSVVQWNTVGEIRGSEHPDEIVLIGAHLDSWDLGTGATDNAASSIAVLEAARLLGALKASGVRPRRTIRFAFFTGEEQGLYGSQYYVLRHAAEMPRFQAVLVLDNGTGRITALPLQGQESLRELWTAMLHPLVALGPIPVRSGVKTGTDHMAFEPAGVPSFNYDQLKRGYDWTYHSQLDVFDHAAPADVAQAATVMAVNALQLANLDRLLPRHRR